MWEYKVIWLDLNEEAQLNELAKDNWELVSVVVSRSGAPKAYFKRRKSGIVKA